MAAVVTAEVVAAMGVAAEQAARAWKMVVVAMAAAMAAVAAMATREEVADIQASRRHSSQDKSAPDEPGAPAC